MNDHSLLAVLFRRYLPILIVSLIASLSALAEARIVSVTPSSGPTSGLQRVVIVVSDVDLSCFTVSCVPVRVWFGGVPGTAAAVSDDGRIVVNAPPHAEGVVGVAIETDHGQRVGAENAFTYRPLLDVYERVLVPVAAFGPGAFGSLWHTEIVARTRDGGAVETAVPIFTDPRCPTVCGCGSLNLIGPTPLIVSECFAGSSPAGLILYLPKGNRTVEIQAHVRDLSRSAAHWGTEVPIVRESDLHQTTFGLLNVPADPGFRLTLRIFNPEQRDFAGVAVRILNAFDLLPVAETSLTLRTDPATPEPGLPSIRPSFAEVDLREILPASHPSRLIAEITPLVPITSPPLPPPRVWAYISVTNNETQYVTLVTPQTPE